MFLLLRNKKQKGITIMKRIIAILMAAVMLLALAAGYAVCNAMGNIFSLQCAVTMDSSIQFPILSGVVIFMTAVFGWLFFREKIGKSNLLSLALTLVGIGLFMIPA